MMKVLIVLTLFVAAVCAFNDLESGDGVCSVCSTVDGNARCCSGNTLCEFNNGANKCTQTIAVRDDNVPARTEYLRAERDGQLTNYCSICCGVDSSATKCCTGSTRCSCTKALQPSCITE